ncbi:VanZ family protein [Methylomonas sp. SURF-1]|uniref:VanZ family protein n=1 Tax=Methylomonas aurea TaxID=2952224 RepID=A0ABT1ULR1_9GAMM|nr:VanZ family protein [Methylomonas sp. SURF-1]MCQ8183174.1 VanZ family protein [Methylomonas sp. SURF-1]
MFFKSITIVFICIITICFFNYFPQFIYSDAELLTNPSFSDGLSSWVPSKTGVKIQAIPEIGTSNSSNLGTPSELSAVLFAQSFEHAITLGQFIPPVSAGSLLHLSAYTKTIDVTDGKRPWETARIVLLAYDRFGKPMYNHPHLLVAQNGTSDWTRHEQVFRVAENTGKLQLLIQLIHAEGQFFVKTLSLRPVVANSEFASYRAWFIAVWTFLALWIGAPFLRRASTNRSDALILLIALGILAGVSMPQSLKQTIGDIISPSADFGSNIEHANALSIFQFTFSIPELDIYKYGHFAMFTLLAAAANRRSSVKLPTLQKLFLITLFAFASEVLQLFVPGRGPQVGDILIDTAGIITGLAWSTFCAWQLNKR